VLQIPIWGTHVRRLLNLWRDTGGNTAIIFGLAAIPLLALGGGAVDFAARARVRGEMQSAGDTAALAAARQVQDAQLKRDSTWSENWIQLQHKAEQTARNLLAAGIKGTEGSPHFDVSINEEAVIIHAHYDMKTSFLGVIGMNTLAANTLSEVRLPDSTLVEISLVLDYSLSMNQNNKYQRMTAAARDFITKVGNERGERTKIGIVPFSEFVYADVANSDARAPDTSGTNKWDGGSSQDGGWSGGSDPDDPTATASAKCLVNRDYPYSVTNDTPLGAIGSKWQQADPDGSRCRSYESGGLKARDLTSDFAGLGYALSGMHPVGWTNIALATEMGWHMLSPNEPFTTARDYSDPKLKKILILLTDGVQTIEAMGPTGEVSIDGANNTTEELCDNIKASGISVYTIAYDVDDTSVYSLLSGCASGPSSYFEVHDSSGIGDVFTAIFDQIAESAWLSK
jgi:Flp pilus assembly protein TadG